MDKAEMQPHPGAREPFITLTITGRGIWEGFGPEPRFAEYDVELKEGEYAWHDTLFGLPDILIAWIEGVNAGCAMRDIILEWPVIPAYTGEGGDVVAITVYGSTGLIVDKQMVELCSVKS